jgi:uncharacterized protein with PQ loop repeat
MATTSLPMLAGITSTVIFAASTLPMLVKAWRTRDLRSYSRGNLLLANLGNAVHSIYVYSMPAGPIWLLHTFYLLSSALMLLWSVRYGALRGQSSQPAERDRGSGNAAEWTSWMNRPASPIAFAASGRNDQKRWKLWAPTG